MCSKLHIRFAHPLSNHNCYKTCAYDNVINFNTVESPGLGGGEGNTCQRDNVHNGVEVLGFLALLGGDIYGMFLP